MPFYGICECFLTADTTWVLFCYFGFLFVCFVVLQSGIVRVVFRSATPYTAWFFSTLWLRVDITESSSMVL